MYTQCPECEIAFRVTADVLKQAAGMVRCGGCANAFNALAFLSESAPEEAATTDTGSTAPELTPEIIDTDNSLPKTISAQQSAALLKTLDELAGSDVRIEDTGVEWRVLDEEEAAAPAAQDADAGEIDVIEVNETLDDSVIPIDKLLASAPEIVDSSELFDASANGLAQMPVEELRFDDNTPLPDDFDLDDESSHVPEPQPETETSQPETTESTPEIALSEPDEWQDILGEFQELAQEVAAPIEIEEIADEEPENTESSGNAPLDMDTQFALQAETMGIDLSGIDELDEEPEPPEGGTSNQFQNELEIALEEEMRAQLENNGEPEEEDPEFVEEISQQDLIEEQVEPLEASVENPTIEEELALLDDGKSTDGLSDTGSPEEHPVPPMTDEEHTVNMLIDQDLMALAIEDEDGFASTIIISEKNAKKMAVEASADPANDEGDEDTNASGEGSGIEEIIMEGEFVRSAIDSEKLATDTAAAASLSSLAETSISDRSGASKKMRYGMVGGVVLLVLLAVQAMHQSREALATIPAFNDTVGEVYRAIGQPVQPAWDISGWRFEATKGSTEGDEEELTVYSRIGNESDGPLPYPLIGISLTDRFEETIGSRILDPAEYLPTDLDPGELVEPGNTFDALITIKSATTEAAGFKLNVCYRLSDAQLRCAVDDFK